MRLEQNEVKASIKDYAICLGAATVIVGVDWLASIHVQISDFIHKVRYRRERLDWTNVQSNYVTKQDDIDFLVKMRGKI